MDCFSHDSAYIRGAQGNHRTSRETEKLGPKRQRAGQREREEKYENSLQKLIQFPSFWKCHIRVHEISDVLQLQQLLNLSIIY